MPNINTLPVITTATDQTYFLVADKGFSRRIEYNVLLDNFAVSVAELDLLPSGPSGPQGPVGATGPSGTAGVAGLSGSIGPSGPRGPSGVSGPLGPRGVAGLVGPTGVTGPRGLPGVSNIPGPQGPTGVTGPTGQPGVSNIPGAQGPSGPSGPDGVSGPSGPNGVSGPSGPNGVSGPSGPTGAPSTISGPSGPGVLSGGLTGQVLVKTSNQNFDTRWSDIQPGLEVRRTVTTSTAELVIGQSGNLDIIDGHKSYLLQKVSTSAAAWIIIYSDSNSRSQDQLRPIGTDPLPGSGVIAEVITSGNSTQLITPGVIGFNNDTPAGSTIYLKVVNRSGISQPITVNLTILKMEN